MSRTKSKAASWFVLWVVLVLITLWGGAFLVHWLGPGHWAVFPVSLTSALIIFFSAVFAGESVIRFSKEGGEA